MPVTYTTYPVTVDGVRLDSAAWGIEARGRATAPVRAADVVLPGVDGVSASLNDDLDQMVRVYNMWLLGTDADGVIPGGSNAMSQCLANLDQLTFLFGTRHRLLDVQEVVDHTGTVRQFWGKVAESISPEIRAGGLGKFTVTINVPAGTGQDVSSSDFTKNTMTSGVFYEVTTLTGSTGPISDAIITLLGPVNNPIITDQATGAYVQLNANLGGSDVWRINCSTWATRYGAGLTFASADTAGTNGDPVTQFGGGGSAFLRMRPALSGGLRKVQLSVTGASMTTATTLGVRARRKFLI
jgi:hypothetical protein